MYQHFMSYAQKHPADSLVDSVDGSVQQRLQVVRVQFLASTPFSKVSLR